MKFGRTLGPLFAALMALPLWLAAQDEVVISEVMAVNNHTLPAEDGKYYDWIELYNAGNAAVDLTGWYLRATATLWRFPATTLDANAYLVVYASGLNRRVPGQPLHTNFKLKNDGEYLALLRPDGTTVVSEWASYPLQMADISYGYPVTSLVVSLVSTGSVGRLLVPGNDAADAAWKQPEFNDAAWRMVTNGVGFETVALTALPSNVLANSVLEFSGTQGRSNWFYGYWHKKNDADGIYDPVNDFVPFPRGTNNTLSATNYWNGSKWDWPLPANPPWTELSAAGGSPGGDNGNALLPVHWLIRRWVSESDGPLRITGTLAATNACGDGVIGRVYVDGVEVFQQPIWAQSLGYSFITPARTGSLIDFILDPGPNNNDQCDYAVFTAVIRPAGNAAVVADSRADWSESGTQGENSWYYGYFVKTNASVTYSTNRFTPFPSQAGPHSAVNFWDGLQWHWFDGDPPFDTLGRDWAWPSYFAGGSTTNAYEHWVIRRWVSEITGTIVIDWHVSKKDTSGGGLTARVLQNGTQKDSLSLTAGDFVGTNKTSLALNVQTGDVLDFTVEPGVDMMGDLCAFNATIYGVTTLSNQFRTDIGAQMANVNSSAYLRVPFTVTNALDLTSLTLRLKYKDGFVAWLNGSPVASRNAPEAPQWNSAATAMRPNAQAAQYEEFGLSRAREVLRAGTNVLAIQGLTSDGAAPGFLLAAELRAGLVNVDTSRRNYFLLPTPGGPNGPGSARLGPFITEVQHTPAEPADADDLTVTARITRSLNPLGTVRLYYRVMFSNETSVAMLDDGLHGDGGASNGVYGAVIPKTAASPGQLIRYYIVATDTTGTNSSRAPLFPDSFSSQYYGTVVRNPQLTNPLPVLHLFITAANMSTANSDMNGRSICSLYYLGELYDNIGINLHGQSSQGFPKKSYDLDFNADHQFRWAPGEQRVGDINLMTTFPDKGHIRNILAYETYQNADCPYHFTSPVRLQTNGGFFGDWCIMENGGAQFVKRLGRDPNGALYKMYNTFTGIGDTTIGINGSFAEKKTRKQEGNADLVALFNGMNLTGTNQLKYIYDHIDISESINMLAARIVTADVDCCHKNYYLYCDNDGTGEWEAYPWDVDLSFGRVWTSAETYWSDLVNVENCGLYVGGNNSYFSPLLNLTPFRQMYLRRVRSLMDELQQPPGTPVHQLKFEKRIDELAALIQPDAALDLMKWGTWGGGSYDYPNIRTNSQYWRTMPQSILETKTNYMVRRRAFVFTAKMGGDVPNAQPTNATIVFKALDFNPASGNQAEEYLQLGNTNNYAVDISGWKLDGAVRHTFQGGVVMPTNGLLHVVADKKAFRNRSRTPRGGMSLYVEGPYQGQLSARGETLILLDKTGRVVSTNRYAGAPTPAQTALRITEIMYHPALAPAGSLYTEEEFEYLELKNIGAAPLDLTGVRFAGGIEFDFTGSAVTNLAAGQSVLVVRNTNAFALRYGSGFNIAGQYAGALDNNGERLRLVDAVGEVVLEFSYDNKWYPITDGAGASLVIVNENAPWDTWGYKASWRPSANEGGSPGVADPQPRVVPPVLVSEALTHTVLPQVDAIELFNPPTNAAVNLGGWFISDDLAQPKKFRIPAGTTLAAGSYLVFTERDFNPPNGGASSFAFSALGDEAYLFSGDGTNLTGFLHGFAFGAAESGVSFGRYVDSQGREQFVAQSALTLGTNNAYPRVGPVVVSEIMYHPLDTGSGDNSSDEYVELHNIAATPTPLYDTNYPTNTWRLRQAVDFDFPTNTTLPVDGYLLVVSFDPADPAQLARFRARYSLDTAVPIFGPYQGKLNNAGDSLELYKPDMPETNGNVPYVLVERIEYSDLPPWPAAADGMGPSLQRVHVAQFGNDPANWAAALSPGVAYGGTAPVLTTPPAAQTVVARRDISFTVQATGTAPLIYQWCFNGASIPNANGPALLLTNVQPYQAGPYSVVVYNPAGSVQSSNAILTVLIPPSILTAPTNQNVKAGANLTLRVVATNTAPPLRYQWQFNGQNIPGATNSSYTLVNVQIEQSGDYRVLVSDAIATEISDPARITVLMDPIVVAGPQSAIVAVGADVDLDVAVTNKATLPISFRLRRNTGVLGDFIVNQRALTYTLTNVLLSNAATYFYSVTNIAKYTATFSPTSYVAVVAPPTNVAAEAGAEAVFTVIAGMPGSLARPAPMDFQWQYNGAALSNASHLSATWSTSASIGTNAGIVMTTNSLLLSGVQPGDSGTYGPLVSIITNVPISPVLFAATLRVGAPDRDGDGMPDAWELVFGLNPDDPRDALADADKDGMNNLAEYQAGTDPKNPNSYLKVDLVSGPRPGATNVVLRFGAVSNKTYSVLYQNPLAAGGAWASLTNLAGAPTNRTVTVSDPSPSAPARYYRVRTP